MSAKPASQHWLAGLGSQATRGDQLIEEPAVDWRDRLIQTERGIKSCLENVLVALEYAPGWKGVLHFDESALQVVAKVKPPLYSREPPFPWRDDDDVRAAAWMQRQGIMVSKDICGQAIQTVARVFPFHPIRDYLNQLMWDGIPRIDEWLTLYLSVDPSDYARAVGSKWLIGAVARIFKPGCKKRHLSGFRRSTGHTQEHDIENARRALVHGRDLKSGKRKTQQCKSAASGLLNWRSWTRWGVPKRAGRKLS